MKLAVWLVRPEGLDIGKKLSAELGAALIEPWLKPANQNEQFALTFRQYQGWIIIGTTGIAVRFLDGLTADKHTDPAVVVVDEGGRFAVSLLSGHEGGANDLAFQAASALGAMPVVTTATESLKPLVLGIGCRRGASADAIESAVALALGSLNSSGASLQRLAQVRHVATIDLKKDEPGLLEFCARHQLPLHVIKATDVAARSWVTKGSDWVKQVTGAPGVCEPCALMSSLRGQLLVPKLAHAGVTVAVAGDELAVSEAEPAMVQAEVGGEK
jgi:cobalt-precorrin 5A hydrolase